MKREEITALVGEIAVALTSPPAKGSDADISQRQAFVALTVDVFDNLGRLADAGERIAVALESIAGGRTQGGH